MASKKALVLFSGGLDSRLAVKFMEKLGFEVVLCFVKLPFCCTGSSDMNDFVQKNNYEFILLDATEGELFEEYVEFVRNPRYGVGTSANPCRDCKIFIFKEAGKVAKEIGADVIVTGEVLGQRPMSQMKKSLLFDEEEAGLKGRVLRPLSAKLLPETFYEKEGIVNREKLLDISGRKRDRQMKLAEKYKISYPSPGGGCLLCEKEYGKRLRCLFDYKKDVGFEEILLLNKARMFKASGLLFVGKDKEGNDFIEEVAKKIGWFVLIDGDIPGPTVIYDNEGDKELAYDLLKAYRSKDLKGRTLFDKYKI